MSVVFDSDTVLDSDADEALTALFTQGGLPIQVSHLQPRMVTRTTVEQWSFTRHTLFIARGDALRLTRSRAELDIRAPEGVRLGYQLTGSYRLLAGQHQEADGAGQLNLTDLTQPCEFTQYGPGAATGSLELSWDDLGLDAQTVRRSVPSLQSSPVYPLMRAHMARLCVDAAELIGPDLQPHIGQATLQLSRALIGSAVDDSTPTARTALHDALHARIIEYILLRLSDPSLSPDRIAAANNISLRELYRAWSHHPVGVAEWIILQRLARAAAALTDDRQPRKTISAIAYSTGFKDAAHFSRRFRATYGVSPHTVQQGAPLPAARESSRLAW